MVARLRQGAGPDSFDRWMRTGSRTGASRSLSAERFADFEADLMAATPIGADGLLHIPFGTLYLTARHESRGGAA